MPLPVHGARMEAEGRCAMTIVRWTPFMELDSMERRMRRWFEEFGFAPAPAADVYKTDDEYVVELELPGYEEKELSIEVSDHTLAIKGERAKVTDIPKPPRMCLIGSKRQLRREHLGPRAADAFDSSFSHLFPVSGPRPARGSSGLAKPMGIRAEDERSPASAPTSIDRIRYFLTSAILGQGRVGTFIFYQIVTYFTGWASAFLIQFRPLRKSNPWAGPANLSQAR